MGASRRALEQRADLRAELLELDAMIEQLRDAADGIRGRALRVRTISVVRVIDRLDFAHHPPQDAADELADLMVREIADAIAKKLMEHRKVLVVPSADGWTVTAELSVFVPYGPPRR